MDAELGQEAQRADELGEKLPEHFLETGSDSDSDSDEANMTLEEDEKRDLTS